MYSDYKCGAISDSDFRNMCARENRKEREYIDIWERLAEETEDEKESEDYDEWE